MHDLIEGQSLVSANGSLIVGVGVGVENVVHVVRSWADSPHSHPRFGQAILGKGAEVREVQVDITVAGYALQQNSISDHGRRVLSVQQTEGYLVVSVSTSATTAHASHYAAGHI